MKQKPFLREISLKRDGIANFNEYPFQIPAIQHLKTLKFHEDITFLVGENGSGKSTLIEAIALGVGFGPEGGTRNVRLETHQNTSDLYQHLNFVYGYKRPTDYYFLRSESFYNLATYMEETNYLGGYGGKSLHEQSHGEAFFATITNKLTGNGLYIFDEPEAALSPQRQLSALATIHDLVRNHSQFIIATHSPILLSYPNAAIYQLGEDGIKRVGYEETDCYLVTKDFLNNYQKSLKILLEDF